MRRDAHGRVRFAGRTTTRSYAPRDIVSADFPDVDDDVSRRVPRFTLAGRPRARRQSGMRSALRKALEPLRRTSRAGGCASALSRAPTRWYGARDASGGDEMASRLAAALDSPDLLARVLPHMPRSPSVGAPLPRVAVGLSGGVDSAVAAWLLKTAGFDVTGVLMRNWDEAEETGGECTFEKDQRDARAVAAHLGIPLREVDFVKEYWHSVFEPFLRDFEGGAATPNPGPRVQPTHHPALSPRHCETALGADILATGHYARVARGSLDDHTRRSASAPRDRSSRINPIPRVRQWRRERAPRVFPPRRLDKDRGQGAGERFGVHAHRGDVAAKQRGHLFHRTQARFRRFHPGVRFGRRRVWIEGRGERNLDCTKSTRSGKVRFRGGRLHRGGTPWPSAIYGGRARGWAARACRGTWWGKTRRPAWISCSSRRVRIIPLSSRRQRRWGVASGWRVDILSDTNADTDTKTERENPETTRRGLCPCDCARRRGTAPRLSRARFVRPSRGEAPSLVPTSRGSLPEPRDHADDGDVVEVYSTRPSGR